MLSNSIPRNNTRVDSQAVESDRKIEDTRQLCNNVLQVSRGQRLAIGSMSVLYFSLPGSYIGSSDLINLLILEVWQDPLFYTVLLRLVGDLLCVLLFVL